MKALEALDGIRRGARLTDRRARALLGAALLLPATLSSAATDAEREAVREQLAQAWYYTEVIIFQRPAVMDFLSDEALVPSTMPGFPAGTQSFMPAAIGFGREDGSAGLAEGPAGLDADVACLAFPRMAPGAPPAEDALETSADSSGDPAAAGESPDADQEQAEALLPVPAASPDLEPDPLLDYLNAVAEFEKSLQESSLTLLPPDDLQLGREAARIDGDRRFQVLWHGGWLQAIPGRDAPAPLLIQTGQRSGEVYQLEGTVDVTLGRYLHFHARLFYHEPLLGDSPAYAPMPPAPAGDAATAETTAVSSEMVSALGRHQPQFMALDESRRMRSSELHYLDHPKLGVLVRIEPVEPPDTLVEAYLALEESSE